MADFNMTRQTARSALPCGFPSFVTLLQQDVCACVASMHASITQWPWAAMNIYGELLLAGCILLLCYLVLDHTHRHHLLRPGRPAPAAMLLDC